MQLAAALAAEEPRPLPAAYLRAREAAAAAARVADTATPVLYTAEGPIAFSPSYDGSAWLWVPVIVLGYDGPADRYRVKFLTSGPASMPALRAAAKADHEESAGAGSRPTSASSKRPQSASNKPRQRGASAGRTAQSFASSTAGATPSAAEYARWTEDVAEDPASNLPRHARIGSSNLDKWVARLHLRFAGEPLSAFTARRAAASRRRELAKACLRYVQHVSSLPADAKHVAPFPASWARGIMRRALRRVQAAGAAAPLAAAKVTTDDDEDVSPTTASKRTSVAQPTLSATDTDAITAAVMAEARESYAFALRHAVHLYELLDPQVGTLLRISV
jgi:hypothetical protein